MVQLELELGECEKAVEAPGKRAIVIDIDGSIADCDWRSDMRDSSWDAFYQASAFDDAFGSVVDMVNSLYEAGWPIVCCTGRPEKWRSLTMQWLVRWNVNVGELLMRPDGDYRPAPLVKVELVRNRFGDFSKVLCVFDDRDDVIDAFREVGVTAFQVRA